MKGFAVKCSVGGCRNEARARGLCNPCYQRASKRGKLAEHAPVGHAGGGVYRVRQLVKIVADLGARIGTLECDLAEAREEAAQQRIRAEAAEEEVRNLQAAEASP